ncbi:MAG TPA: AI-2E family transporter [Paludibacteraceae bacterium]|jgi:predicted PurR-regulated permease PerM|nr:AI-2E family transporter [Paludibacteraceae bacterium]
MEQTERPYTFDRVVRIVITLTVLTALFFLTRRLSGVLLPFLIAWLLAYLLQPVVHFFQYKLKFKYRFVAIFATLLLFIGILTGLGFLLVPMMISEIEKAIVLINSFFRNVDVNSILPIAWQNQLGEYLSQLNLQTLLGDDKFMSIVQKLLPQVWNFIGSSLNFVLGLAVIVIIFLYLFFILMDYERISEKWIELVPIKYRPLITNIVQDVQDGMNRYFRGQALIAMCVGILFMIGLSIIRLPLAIVLGLCIGILNLVPYLELLGIIPCAFMALLKASETNENFWMIALSIAAVWLTVQAIQDLILVPRIMGKYTGLHPALILLSLSIWGSLLGFAGMIIALPITSLILSYYKRFIIKGENIEHPNAPNQEHATSPTSAEEAITEDLQQD